MPPTKTQQARRKPKSKAVVSKPPAKRTGTGKAAQVKEVTAEEVLRWLKAKGSGRNRDGMARYGIVARNVFGVSVGDLRRYAKSTLGRNHALAEALWKADCYEARMLASFVDDPAAVTSAQMDRWCKDFDNWAICDTICFHLFDRTPFAWKKVAAWAPRKEEFVRRAAFALLASLTVHSRTAEESAFLTGLELIEVAASDERNFVKKAVNWALRSIGKRNLRLHAAALTVAERLASRQEAAPRWVGKDALAELRSAAVLSRLERKG